MDYKQKYLKYKAKYLELKGGNEGMTISQLNEQVKNGLYYPQYFSCSKGLCIKRTEYHKIVGFEHNIEEGKLLPKFDIYTDPFINAYNPIASEKKVCESIKKNFFITKEKCAYTDSIKFAVIIVEEEVEVEGKDLKKYEDQNNSPKDPPNPKKKINVLKRIV